VSAEIYKLDFNRAPEQARGERAPTQTAQRERYVPTPAAQRATEGHEAEIVRALGIAWHGRGHINCPYPGHPDKDPSWRLMEDGKAVCTCRGPHSIFDVVTHLEGIDFEAAKLRVVDLIDRDDLIVDPNNKQKASTVSGLTVREYVEAKGFSLDLLQQYGIQQARYGKNFPQTVKFPYFHANGESPSNHFRLALNGPKDDRFRWGRGDKISLYGEHWADEFRQLGHCVLLEGETDALTSWMHRIPAMGLPGATTWNESRDAAVLAAIPVVFVVIEPDDGGKAMLNWLVRSSILPRARLVRMPAGLKDPNELYLANRAGFRAAFQAALDSAEPVPKDLIPKQPTIIVRAGALHKLADEGLAAMQAAGIEFYQRDRDLVRVARIKTKASDGTIVTTPGIIPVPLPMLRRALGQSAEWMKPDPKGKLYPIDPPKDVNEQIAAMVGEWPFPPLSGVISTPTIRPDGTLLLRESYDEATGLVLLSPPKMPAIPERPTERDAKEALALLEALLEEFPFTKDEGKSLSVALSMLMTPVLRGAGIAPIHLVNKPEAGTGGSYLADVASVIATGEKCAVVSRAPNDPNETEKRLIGAAIAGFPIICLDNWNAPLEGDFLCQVSERPLLQLRRLGKSPPIRVTNSFTVFANGNKVSAASDVIRRTIQCGLDANMESPEDRQFKHDPIATILANRGAYIAACLIIARAYIAAGRPGKLKLPSFDGWSDTVRSALCWVGKSDPVSTMAIARADDPIRQERVSVFSALVKERFVELGYLTSEIVDQAEKIRSTTGLHDRGGLEYPALHAALLAVAEHRGVRGKIDPLRLAKWLARNANNIATIDRAPYKLVVDRSDSQRPRWKLGEIKKQG
jgi:hypothetical protein